jgi:hypothetical protein
MKMYLLERCRNNLIRYNSNKNIQLFSYKTILFFSFITMLFTTSCTGISGKNKTAEKGNNTNNEQLSPKEYVQWLRDVNNGINKEKTIDDITFSIQYKPSEYIVCMEEKKDQLSDSLLKGRQKELTDMEYYDLTIGLASGQGELLKHDLKSTAQYEERVNYFAFNMQHDINLVEDGDTIPCGLYHFERTYDVAPYSKFLLGFVKGKHSKPKERTLAFYDKIFNKGLIKFTYTDEDFNNIPKLKTNDEL